MGGPASAAVVAVRVAVRDALRVTHDSGELGAGALVLVACSGGADSIALASSVAWVAPRMGLRAGAVVVDHGLQEGSDRVAAIASDTCSALGLNPVEVVRVVVRIEPGGDGPEARARAARHAAFGEVAARTGASAILLAHTRDDQAETVLLGLARGSGARALSGMAPDVPLSGTGVRMLRPLLALDRATVRAAAAESGFPLWEDPHNADPSYARARVRHGALPALQAALGPGARRALARTADLLRADADALDGWADRAYASLAGPLDADTALDADSAVVAARGGHKAARSAVSARRTADVGTADVVELDVAGLAGLPAAVRTRVLMRAALDVGVPAKRLTAVHVAAVDALVARWHGQGEVRLPGGVTASRGCGRLRLAAQPADPAARTPVPHPSDPHQQSVQGAPRGAQ